MHRTRDFPCHFIFINPFQAYFKAGQLGKMDATAAGMFSMLAVDG